MILAILVGSWLLKFAITPLHLQPDAQEVMIVPNSTLKNITHQLVQGKVLRSSWEFLLLNKLMDSEAKLRSGNYTFNKNITPYQLVTSLMRGRTTQGSITFIEGRTFKQMREKIAQNDALKATTTSMTDRQILDAIGVEAENAEGLFFPDTFYFNRGIEDVVILKQSHTKMQQLLEKLWQQRDNNLPYQTPYDALIMASIIEKETGKASERPMIAGVFLNRLQIGMRLQTDPTVIYGMGEQYHGNIRRKDLITDTPYNTYTRTGLPPTPIAMPGLASIEAALHPAKTKALYFVGKGDGSHAFSNSLIEHNRAVTQYQLKKGQ